MSAAEKKLAEVFQKVNQTKQWHEFPLPLQLLNLVALRNDLRDHNLYDTPLLAGSRKGLPATVPPRSLRARTPGGTWNDLSDPAMGSAGSRFARNLRPGAIHPDPEPGKSEPNPREVALKLMARDTFKPATTLNVLAAAWIQFQNHNWFFHGKGSKDDVLEVPLRDGDDWPENPMRIRRTVPLQRSDGGENSTSYGNTESHWWDGSQIYGATLERQSNLRTFEDGKLKIGTDGRLLEDAKIPGLEQTGFQENWWVGLSLLHTLFTKEHNHICDHLKARNPNWGDQQLFDTAWLINSALMAKIHTVEWTPGILAHPALKIGMEANWWGMAGRKIKNRFGRLASDEAISGIVGSPQSHHGAPFQLTEEFVSVYRLHPLIPDDWKFFSLETGELASTAEFDELQGKQTRSFMSGYGASDLLYSFGIANPGAVTLKNYPRALMRHARIENNGELVDLATLDVVRDRERGIPRYNDFREELRMPRIESFEAMTPNRALAQEIREVYGDVDKVDLQVGMYAEPLPNGFGFSDTAFRIFILMASRRLKSDRFFTNDFTAEVYTQDGLDYIERNGMRDVLLRHHPDLEPALEGVDNVFAPWTRLPGGIAGR